MTEAPSIRAARASDVAEILSIDDDSARLYATAGLVLALTDDNPYLIEERRRWREAVERGDGLIASLGARAVGMAVLGVVDGAAYLDQLSVRLDAMRRGVGRALIDRALSWAAGRAQLTGRGLWLNTYGHLPWNVPYYERCGFVLVPERAWGPQMRALVDFQRRWLPEPTQRVVMQRPLSAP